MSVHELTLPSGKTTFQVRYRDGVKHRSKNFPTRRAATTFDDDVDEMRRTGELARHIHNQRVTLADMVVEWWDRRRDDVSAQTRENYGIQFDKRILPELGTRTVRSLRPADVERWMNTLRRSGDAEPTVRKALTALQAVLTVAVRDGVIAVNPVAAVPKPRVQRKRVPYLIGPDLVERIRLDLAIRQRPADVLLLDLLAYCGLRPESEAVTLRWGHVRARSLIVRDTKNGQERTVPLLEPVVESLQAWRQASGTRHLAADLVVPGPQGAWSRNDWRNWRRRVFAPSSAWAADLPDDARPRDLRSSFVSLLIHEGRSIVEVARQCGHSPEICLRDYAQIVDDVDPFNRMPAADAIRFARANVRFRFARHALTRDADAA